MIGAVFPNRGNFKMGGEFWELNSTHLKVATVGKHWIRELNYDGEAQMKFPVNPLSSILAYPTESLEL